MSTTRFLLSNRLLTATLKNGTGAPAPSLDETAPYTMAMAQNAERGSFWKSSAAPTYPLYVDYDLGANASCSGAFALAYSAIGTTFLLDLTISSSTAANGYPPSSGNPWTVRGSTSLIAAPRDTGVAFAAASARYWRFEFNEVPASGAQFSIGRLALGSLTDLEVIASPGGEDSPRGARIIQSTPGGHPYTTDLSEFLGRDITLPFRGITDTLKASLETIATTSGTIILFDARDLAYEVVVPERRLNVVRQFYNGSQHIYDCELRLMRLP